MEGIIERNDSKIFMRNVAYSSYTGVYKFIVPIYQKYKDKLPGENPDGMKQ